MNEDLTENEFYTTEQTDIESAGHIVTEFNGDKLNITVDIILKICSTAFILSALVLAYVLITHGSMSEEVLSRLPYGFNPPMPEFLGTDDKTQDKNMLLFSQWCIVVIWLALAKRLTWRAPAGGLAGIFLIISLFVPICYIVWQILGVCIVFYVGILVLLSIFLLLCNRRVTIIVGSGLAKLFKLLFKE